MAVFLADLMAGPLVSLETKTLPLQSQGDALVGTLEGVVKDIDARQGTVRVASGFVGISSKRFVVAPQTRIGIDDKLGALADLERGQLVRVSYEIRSDRLLASRVKLLRRGMPETEFPADPDAEIAELRDGAGRGGPSGSIAEGGRATPGSGRPSATPSKAVITPPVTGATPSPSAVTPAPSAVTPAPSAVTSAPSAAMAAAPALTPAPSGPTSSPAPPNPPRSLASDGPAAAPAGPSVAKPPAKKTGTAAAKKPRVKPRVAPPRPKAAESPREVPAPRGADVAPPRPKAAESPRAEVPAPRGADSTTVARERDARGGPGLASR
jgi:hypothetical protein